MVAEVIRSIIDYSGHWGRLKCCLFSNLHMLINQEFFKGSENICLCALLVREKEGKTIRTIFDTAINIDIDIQGIEFSNSFCCCC